MHRFDTLAESWAVLTEDPVTATTTMPEGWGQGRASFGGLVVASAAALAGRYRGDRTLRTVQAQLVAPVAPGPLEATLVRLREGRTTLLFDCTLTQAGAVVARILLTFVRLQPDATVVSGPSAPDWPDPDGLLPMPYIEGMSPAFTRHVDIRLTEGTFPFMGGNDARFGGYVRFGDARPSPELALAMLDAFWCPTLSILDRPVPASTATWTAHLLAQPGEGPHRFACETVVAAGGFTTEVGRLWRPDGELVAWSEQTAVVFG